MNEVLCQNHLDNTLKIKYNMQKKYSERKKINFRLAFPFDTYQRTILFLLQFLFNT